MVLFENDKNIYYNDDNIIIIINYNLQMSIIDIKIFLNFLRSFLFYVDQFTSISNQLILF